MDYVELPYQLVNFVKVHAGACSIKITGGCSQSPQIVLSWRV